MNKDLELQWKSALSSESRNTYDDHFFGNIDVDGWKSVQLRNNRTVGFIFLAIGYALLLDSLRVLVFESSLILREEFTDAHPGLTLLALIGLMIVSGAIIVSSTSVQKSSIKILARVIPIALMVLIILFEIGAGEDAADVISSMVVVIIAPYLVGCAIGYGMGNVDKAV